MTDQPVHILLTMTVNDPAKLGEYFAQVTPLMADRHRVAERGTDTVTMLEGEWDHHIEWSSCECPQWRSVAVVLRLRRLRPDQTRCATRRPTR
ncbi:MAG: hypothetical protein R2705_17680 [Ilumatobacteraceae bacterium]